jgi:replicative DNA helicase
MQFYTSTGRFSVPDDLLFNRIYRSQATISEAQDYYLALNELLQQSNLEPNLANQALDHFLMVQQLLQAANAIPATQDTEFNLNPQHGHSAITQKLERSYVANKTLDEISTEILDAATSRQHKLALTKVAAVNNLPHEVVELLAKNLLKERGLADKYDIDRKEYGNCVDEISKIEMAISDPGEKAWKLQALARKYKRTVHQLQEVYYKSLIAQHVSKPIDEDQLDIQYGGSQKWLMRGWLPVGALVLFHAQGGVGKTLFLQHLVKHLASGEDWEEYKVERQHSILYVQTDTAPLQMKDWMRQSGILGKGYKIKFHLDWQIEYMAQLHDWIERDRPDLVVIDSLASVNRLSLVSENDVAYAKPILQMRDISRKFGTSFFLIHHSNAADQARGTKALRNAVDAVWNLKYANNNDPSNPERELVMEKFRARCPQKYKLRFNDSDYSWDLMESDVKNGESPQSTTARKILVNHLHQNKGVRYTICDLAYSANLAEGTVRRELAGLVREGLVNRLLNLEAASTGGRPKHFYMVD